MNRPTLRAAGMACAAAGLLALSAPSARAADGQGWSGQLTPYAWGAGLDSTLTPFTGAPTVRIDKSFGEVFEDLDAAFFLSGYARRGRTVLLGDLSHSDASRDGIVPPGVPAEGRLRQSSVTLAAGWRAIDGPRVHLDLLAGLRHWRVRGAVEVPLAGFARSPRASFTDPLVALRAHVALAPRWSLVGYGDVGVFGGGADHTHQWLATVNYRHDARWVVSGGLRQLRVDYRSGGTRLDATLSGPLLGVTRQF